MAEGGRIEPGRHAGREIPETTQLRRLVEDGANTGRHAASDILRCMLGHPDCPDFSHFMHECGISGAPDCGGVGGCICPCHPGLPLPAGYVWHCGTCQAELHDDGWCPACRETRTITPRPHGDPS